MGLGSAGGQGADVSEGQKGWPVKLFWGGMGHLLMLWLCFKANSQDLTQLPHLMAQKTVIENSQKAGLGYSY